MKNICFNSIRQARKFENMYQNNAQKNQLDSTWYTDNIYSNQSEDLDDEYIPEYIKSSTFRKLQNLREFGEFHDTKCRTNNYIEDDIQADYKLHRSISCRELNQYPKTHATINKRVNKRENEAIKNTSILRNPCSVPKSYSFSATTKTTPFDVMDYDLKLPLFRKNHRGKNDSFRNSFDYPYNNYSEDNKMSNIRVHGIHSCCTREYCTNAKCLFNEIYPCNRDICRRGVSVNAYPAHVGEDNNRSLHIQQNWRDESKKQFAATRVGSHYCNSERKYEHFWPVQHTMVVCCSEDCCCCQRRYKIYANKRNQLHCSKYHPAAEDEEDLHYRSPNNPTDIDYFINDEREHFLTQSKYLNDHEHYLNSASNPKIEPSMNRYSTGGRSAFVEPPPQFDDETCSDSTEIDLEDFNIDLEKYWEELDKPPSPIDHDMQQRNMQSNLKVKNINVACYNNGKPIDIHNREEERMIIKKSLFEGMPSPPQLSNSEVTENPNNLPLMEDRNSHLHQNHYNYGYKVYPFTQNLPSYKYNNFYPLHSGVQSEQNFAARQNPSANGNSALNIINSIFSIYKPNKYSSLNCQINSGEKAELCKKMNVPSTRRPLGAPHSEYMHSMKRPLIVSNEQPHFKIIPEKTGLKISPLYNLEGYHENSHLDQKLSSTARPLMLPH